MKKSSHSAKFIIHLFFTLFILACGGGGAGSGNSTPAPAPAPTFSLEGTSYTVGVSQGGTTEGIMDGGFDVSSSGPSSGNVTSGNYTFSVGTTATLTGGSLLLDGKNLLSGAFNINTGDVNTILYGKLNASKRFASFVSSTNSGAQDLIAVIKSGGSFTLPDIQGIWHICEMSSGGTVADVSYGTMNVDASGSFTSSKGDGVITVETTGIMNGSGSFSPGGTLVIKGKIDASKEIIVMHSIYSNGEYSISVGVKETGVFSLSDLAGRWHFTLASVGGGDKVSYGQIELNSAGQVRGGYYRSAGGNVPLSSGSLSINSGGVLSGSIHASDGSTFTIDHGKMNPSKNMMSVSWHPGTGDKHFIIADKES
jgi:hypothetical protein